MFEVGSSEDDEGVSYDEQTGYCHYDGGTVPADIACNHCR